MTIETSIKLSKTLLLYKQDNSDNWYARINVKGKWTVKTTGLSNQKEAESKAYQIEASYNLRSENDLPLKTRKFKDVAELAIQDMKLQKAIDGKKCYDDYVRMLENTVIALIGRKDMSRVDASVIYQLYQDIAERNNGGKQLSKSTLLNYNSALNHVFDYAIDNDYMLQGNRPRLTTSTGKGGDRRASFTPKEIEFILNDIGWFFPTKGKQITKEIKALLFDYIMVAVHSGMRPGTEMENLKWGHISTTTKDNQSFYLLNVVDGKTSRYTGDREIVVNMDIKGALERLKKRNVKTTINDFVFRMPNGDNTGELSRTFSRYLEEKSMDTSGSHNRTLYSLRHTYITWQLENGIEPYIIGHQCGTSVQMIEKFYSHATAKAHAAKLTSKSIVQDPLAKSAIITNKVKISTPIKVTKDGYIELDV
jgi:integrase